MSTQLFVDTSIQGRLWQFNVTWPDAYSAIRAGAVAQLKNLGAMHDAGYARHSRLADWFSSTSVARVLSIHGAGMERFARGDWIAQLLFRQKRDSAVPWVILWAAIGERLERPADPLLDAANGIHRALDGQAGLFADLPEPYRVPQHVRDCIEHASSYQQAMDTLGATHHDIARWLSADPALRARWKQNQSYERVSLAESRLREFLVNSPEATSNDLEMKFCADVRQLRRHAPQVLHQITCSLAPRAGRQKTLF